MKISRKLPVKGAFRCAPLFAALLAGAAPIERVEAKATEPPTIPVGLDAYKQWDRWPYQRIGARAYMPSTFDRHGTNFMVDASNFLYMEAEDFNVTMDVAGPGVLYFKRTNHWHGSPWNYEVDGTNHVVEETSTATPNDPVEDSVFIPEELFPNPLTWTWSRTNGAGLMWRPIPFEDSFRLAYGRTRYGTGYYIYHRYLPDAPLSKRIETWDETPPDPEVLDLIDRAGTDIAPKDIAAETGTFRIGEGDSVAFARLSGEPRTIRALKLKVPREQALALSDARLRVTWDNRAHPSIDAPLAMFFGAGILYNRDDREYLVKGFPKFIRYEDEHVHLASFYPMPFFRSARFEFIYDCELSEPADIEYELRHEPYTDPPNHVGYFHATFRDHPERDAGRDLVLLDTKEVEGGGHWSGSFVGTTIIFSHHGVLSTLEGDPRFFFDNSRTPQAHGTGTEEWGGGGDYWGGENMTLPFAGHPTGGGWADTVDDEHDLILSAYRFLLADLFPFGKRAEIRLERGGENLSEEHYKTVTFWYGLPAPSLVKTDDFDVGVPGEEAARDYHSPDASEPREITSRWNGLIQDVFESGEPRRPYRDPFSYAQWEVEADADRRYFIWLRGRPLSDEPETDAVWLQFHRQINRNIGGTGMRPNAFGNWLEGLADTGELDYTWSSGHPDEPPEATRFREPGKNRIRMQPRFTDHVVDQIWLSTTRDTPPVSNDPQPVPHYEEGEPIEDIVLDVSTAELFGQIEPISDPDASIGQAMLLYNEPYEVNPAETHVGRRHSGTSEFTLRIRPDNHGVLLRRTLDYALPNQRAEVFIADPDDPEGGWEKAGIWYTAGSTTYYHSWPSEQLAPPEPEIKTTERRFLEDEFLVPRSLTQGRSSIRVRIEYTPVKRPLMPGMDPPEDDELAWSEIRYQAYSWVMPSFHP